MDIEKFYKSVDRLIESLKQKGSPELGLKLYEVKKYNYTASEILGGIEMALKEIKATVTADKNLIREIDALLDWINEAFKTDGDRI